MADSAKKENFKQDSRVVGQIREAMNSHERKTAETYIKHRKAYMSLFTFLLCDIKKIYADRNSQKFPNIEVKNKFVVSTATQITQERMKDLAERKEKQLTRSPQNSCA